LRGVYCFAVQVRLCGTGCYAQPAKQAGGGRAREARTGGAGRGLTLRGIKKRNGKVGTLLVHDCNILIGQKFNRR